MSPRFKPTEKRFDLPNAIQSVDEYVSSTAAAVEEQSTVMSEISSSPRRGRSRQRRRGGVANGHSGAMRSIEPGISRFPDAQLRI